MKKSILFFLFLSFFILDVSAQKRAQNNKANEDQKITMPADRQTQSQGRSSRSLIYNYSGYVNEGHYVNIYHDKQHLYPGYKYEVELYVNQGNADLYIYGDGGNKRVIRYSNRSGSTKDESYYKYDDLRPHERSIVCGIYGYYGSRFTIKIYKVNDHHGGNNCHYNDPTHDLSWLRNMKNQYRNDKICEYEYNGKKYFQRYRCGVSHYTEYWYDCYGQKICEFSNGNACHEVKNARFIKCWYEPCGHPPTGHCTWKFWYDDCRDGKEISAGSDYYVKVNAEKYQDIEWMDLYVNGKKVRRENSHPYEWGRPNTSGDGLLRNLQPGNYKLKCVVYDKCGNYHEEYCHFVVKHRQCNYDLWYTHGKNGKHYRKYSDVYVKVEAARHQDIEWCELYVNGKKVRRENSAPYEWGRPNSNGDHLLKRMEPGTYKLRCYYKTKCGQYKEKYSTIYIDNH